MKNNAIWKLKDAETYYELSFVIYALFLLDRLLAWKENWKVSTPHQQQPNNNKNIFPFFWWKVMKNKMKQFFYSFEFQAK